MSISLPASLRAEVEHLVKGGRYGSASEYIRELVRDDLTRRAQDALEQRLLKALKSGPMRPLTEADWKRLHQDVEARARRPATRRARA